MRWALLAASVAAAAVTANASWAQDAKAEPAVQQSSGAQASVTPVAALRSTSPPNAEAGRTYETPEAALLEADIDYLVREAHRAVARNDTDGIWYTAAFADEAAGVIFGDEPFHHLQHAFV